MAEPWFDQEFWDDNFGDFDQEDLEEMTEAVTDIELLAGLSSDDLDVVAKNAHKSSPHVEILGICSVPNWPLTSSKKLRSESFLKRIIIV